MPKTMSPEEKKQISARLTDRSIAILKDESAKLELTQTDYLERLIDGSLPNRLEAKIEELITEIKSWKKEQST
ncbi:MAG: hypothetical protein ACRCUY_08600 [Thermoguttaceae bacterium]